MKYVARLFKDAIQAPTSELQAHTLSHLKVEVSKRGIGGNEAIECCLNRL
jgi:hypothetical protein